MTNRCYQKTKKSSGRKHAECIKLFLKKKKKQKAKKQAKANRV